MATPRVVVVGLGPGDPTLVTEQTRAAILRSRHRFLRTAQHPSAHLVADATSFDHLYESADTFDSVYDDITTALVVAAIAHGEVLYAVPGSPLVLERSVRHLRADQRVECVVLPAVSFLDAAYTALGIDPVETAITLVDGHDFASAAAGRHGPLLIAHCHANWVLSEIKLAIDDMEQSNDALPVVLLQALGTEHERVVHTTWGEMDHAIEADHLTTLYVPRLQVAVGEHYTRFHALARTLREQCPWDIEQTHKSLIPYLIEETYEVVDALQLLDEHDPRTDELLIEELGDLLYQIEFHATIAEQQGRFTIADVTQGIHDKLIRRHPHVFGDVSAETTDAVLTNWDAIKMAEKGRTSIFDGIPTTLPSLALAYKVGKKAAKIGFDWPTIDGAVPKIAEETAEALAAHRSGNVEHAAEELGDLLFAVVNVARHMKVDPEVALRAAVGKFRNRVERLLELAESRGIEVSGADLATLDVLWDDVKAQSH